MWGLSVPSSVLAKYAAVDRSSRRENQRPLPSVGRVLGEDRSLYEQVALLLVSWKSEDREIRGDDRVERVFLKNWLLHYTSEVTEELVTTLCAFSRKDREMVMRSMYALWSRSSCKEQVSLAQLIQAVSAGGTLSAEHVQKVGALFSQRVSIDAERIGAIHTITMLLRQKLFAEEEIYICLSALVWCLQNQPIYAIEKYVQLVGHALHWKWKNNDRCLAITEIFCFWTKWHAVVNVDELCQQLMPLQTLRGVLTIIHNHQKQLERQGPLEV